MKTYTKSEILDLMKYSAAEFKNGSWVTGIVITDKRWIMTLHNGKRTSLYNAPEDGWELMAVTYEC